ncbi:hypothetical protein Hanom_Chr06g00533301 [Helianthus anomalus]
MQPLSSSHSFFFPNQPTSDLRRLPHKHTFLCGWIGHHSSLSLLLPLDRPPPPKHTHSAGL